jgi:nitrate/nitrite transporter NarK
VIERYGRRRVMMVSAFACSTCWTIISIALGLSETGKANASAMGALATTFFFVFFASFGMAVLEK